MPTYSHACKACYHTFDIRQSFTDDTLTDCPECTDATLRKVIHPVGIAFKGSGFYKTDSNTSTKSAPASTAPKSEGSSSSDSSSSSASSGSSSSAASTSAGSSAGSSAAASSSSSSTAPAAS